MCEGVQVIARHAPDWQNAENPSYAEAITWSAVRIGKKDCAGIRLCV